MTTPFDEEDEYDEEGHEHTASNHSEDKTNKDFQYNESSSKNVLAEKKDSAPIAQIQNQDTNNYSSEQYTE